MQEVEVTKKLPIEKKNHNFFLKSCQIALYSTKTTKRELCTVVWSDLQFCLKTRFQIYDSTSLSYRDKTNRPKIKAKQKFLQSSLPSLN